MAEALCLKLIILLVSLELAVLVFLIFLLWSCAKVYEHLKMSECGVATERLTILKTAQQGIRSSRHQGVSPPTNSPPRDHLATKQSLHATNNLTTVCTPQAEKTNSLFVLC